MEPIEVNYWLDQASADQLTRVRDVATEARAFWLAQRLHPIDTFVAVEAAATLEIIALGGLRVVGRA